METSFADQIRQGYLEVLCSLRPEERSDLSCLRESLRARRPGPDRRDRLWALVSAYRSGPRDRWGPVLLEVLATRLIRCLRRLREEPPFAAEEDLRQMLVLELLAAAASMPIGTKCVRIDDRLVARANQGVRRVLERERRRKASQVSLDDVTERDEAMAEAPFRWKSGMATHGN